MKKKEIYKDPKEKELELGVDEVLKDDTFFDPDIDLSIVKVHPGKQEIFLIPPGIEVLRMISQLEVSVKWRKSAKHWIFWFSFFWNAIVSIMILVSLFLGAAFMFLFLIPFVAAGIYMLYSSVGYLINKTYITVDDQKISIEHKPIKFLIQKDKHFASGEVKQLFVKRYSIGSQNDQQVYAYALDLILKDGKNVNLIKQFHSAKTARYVEQQIEHFLDIKDKKVKDEYLGT